MLIKTQSSEKSSHNPFHEFTTKKEMLNGLIMRAREYASRRNVWAKYAYLIQRIKAIIDSHPSNH